jgi:hypothetical protein
MADGRLDQRVIDALHAEVLRAHEKHKHAPGGSLFDPRTSDLALLAALGEEVGEVSEVHEVRTMAALTSALGQVSRALTYDQDRGALYKELVQVGNVALTWAHRLLSPQAGMRVYISGPITGLERHDMELRFAIGCFEVTRMGHTPINPLAIPSPPGCACSTVDGMRGIKHEWTCNLRKGLAIVPTCDAIYLLRGWRASRSAEIELAVAQACGLAVVYQSAENRERTGTKS